MRVYFFVVSADIFIFEESARLSIFLAPESVAALIVSGAALAAESTEDSPLLLQAVIATATARIVKNFFICLVLCALR
jgi:hypothetical protein